MIQELIVHFVGFIALFLLLKKLVWGPVLGALDLRRTQIENDLKHAAGRKAEMEKLQADLAKRLAQIEQEARTRVQEAVQDGKRVSMEIQEQARAQAQAILAKSQETVQLELAKARLTLRDQIADLALQAIEKVLQQRLDEKSDRQLIDRTLSELESSGAK